MTKDDRVAAPPVKAGGGRTTKRRKSDTAASAAEPQIGQALRSVYDRTVNEAIPSEMLDLLGRLD